MAQVRGLGSRVGGRLVLFCIHRVNRVYGALVVTSWTCYGALYCRIIIIIIIKLVVVVVGAAAVLVFEVWLDDRGG